MTHTRLGSSAPPEVLDSSPACRTRERESSGEPLTGLARVLRKREHSTYSPCHADEADSEPTEVQLEHPALAACYDAAALGVEVGGDRAGQPTLRLMSGQGAESAKDPALADLPVAEVRGINLYGRQWVHGRDRKQLERVARYITRPPIAQERLTQRPDGTLLLEFKNAVPTQVLRRALRRSHAVMRRRLFGSGDRAPLARDSRV